MNIGSQFKISGSCAVGYVHASIYDVGARAQTAYDVAEMMNYAQNNGWQYVDSSTMHDGVNGSVFMFFEKR